MSVRVLTNKLMIFISLAVLVATFSLVNATVLSTKKAYALSDLKWYSCVGDYPKKYYIRWSALSTEDTYLKVNDGTTHFVAWTNNYQGGTYYLSNYTPSHVVSITNNGTQTTKYFGSKITTVQKTCF